MLSYKSGWGPAIVNNTPLLSLVKISTDTRVVQSASVAVGAVVQSA